MDNSIVLKVRDISKRFGGTWALKDISFNIGKGEVFGIVGENGAGKSTLMKILSGVYTADTGTMSFEGKQILGLSIRERQKIGISMVYQEINIFPNLSIARNVFASREPKNRFGLVDENRMADDTHKLMKDLDVDLRPNAIMGSLSVAEKQLTQILLALSYNAKIIVYDEANTSLTDEETRKLFGIINGLKSRGVTTIFISHRIEEVLTIADRILVLRDGEQVGILNRSEASVRKIVTMMIGREVGNTFPPRDNQMEISVETLLRIENLTCSGWFSEISFDLGRGEILGMAGLEGSGRTQLAECIIGARKIDGGRMYFCDDEYRPLNTRDSINRGIMYVPPDRRWDGIIPDKSVGFNIALSSFNRFKKGIFIAEKDIDKTTDEYIKKLRIKAESSRQPIMDLSGGNQQKVVFSRVLVGEPSVLILNDPTRGIDVGTKYEIYMLMQGLASQGLGILFISAELEELMALSDRILAMWQGRIAGEFDPKQVKREEILGSIMGGKAGIAVAV